MTEALNPMRFPLHSSRLIEASAGTGKTFTIASLYLRLLIGHGGADSRFERPLTVPEILVVTFTEAATAELKDRIRKKIHDARLAMLDAESFGEADDFIQTLIGELEPEQLATHAQRLLEAEREMDQASVFTIHGFCQRMLKENAFESGTLFETEFLTDDYGLKLQAVQDFWRSEFYPLNLELAAMVRQQWASPESLLSDLSPHLGNNQLKLKTSRQPKPLSELHQQFIVDISRMKQQWLEQRSEVPEQIFGPIKGYTEGQLNRWKWFDKLDQWAAQPTASYEVPDCLAKFGHNLLLSKLKAKQPEPSLELFKQIDDFCQQERTIKDVLLAQAWQDVRQRMDAHKQQHHLLSFDDLLSRLDRALAAPGSEALAQRIRTKFPVAMIDEFQDTDPEQYRIFHRLYQGQADTPADRGLFMIGDPKQAIYAFRGADIFTYIQARNNVSAHYTLETNYRSTSGMVDAVNTLFRFGQAPFIYDSDIPFIEVGANGKNKQLILNEEPVSALNLWVQEADPELAALTVNTDSYQQAMACATAYQINDLLTAAANGKALIGEKPLQAGDIAILVRKGSEARLVRQALEQQGIPSIYLSNRDSVFSSLEAQDVVRILAAALQPRSERTLRAALATGLLALSAQQLDQLTQDEDQWEAAVAEFEQYQQIWLSQGVLPMLRQLIYNRNLAATIRAGSLGERRLTDLLHLGELLQQASAELDSPHSLLRWLGEQIENPNSDIDGQQVRLESEDNLVKVVTIHKSKGLEYELVFLPFICDFKPASSAMYHPETGTALWDLTGSDEAKQGAEKERLAEDLRLLYVAMTRAVHATWVGIAPLKKGRASGSKTDLHKGALGYLLQQGRIGDASELPGFIQGLVDTCPAITVQPLPEQPSAPWQAPAEAEQQWAAREFSGSLERNWWITSFTALSRFHSAADASLETSRSGFDLEAALPEPTQTAQTDSPEPETDNTPSIFSFPRGARAGTFLHALFEQMDFTQAHGDVLSSEVSQQLEQAGYEEHWQPVLEQMVSDVLSCELLPGFSLNQLPNHRRRVEMEFLLPLSELRASELNRLLRQHDPLSAQSGNLEFSTVQGMLKGFIDLVFEHEGKYYVLDYKSNHLGDTPEAYQAPQLEQAMVEHRYDLQYLLYTLALHRLLKFRLGERYDYQQHLGGVYYLFLRGIQPGASTTGVFSHQPSQTLIESLDQLFSQSEQKYKQKHEQEGVA